MVGSLLSNVSLQNDQEPSCYEDFRLLCDQNAAAPQTLAAWTLSVCHHRWSVEGQALTEWSQQVIFLAIRVFRLKSGESKTKVGVWEASKAMVNACGARVVSLTELSIRVKARWRTGDRGRRTGGHGTVSVLKASVLQR